MHIQFYMSFITKVYNINSRSTIEVMYGEIIQDLVDCKNAVKF